MNEHVNEHVSVCVNSELWQACRVIRGFMEGHVHRCEQLTQGFTMSNVVIIHFTPGAITKSSYTWKDSFAIYHLQTPIIVYAEISIHILRIYIDVVFAKSSLQSDQLYHDMLPCCYSVNDTNTTLCKKASNHHANLPLEMYSFTL